MLEISFHLHGDLPALSGPAGQTVWARELREPASVKDALEALGIPHTEVDLLLVDDRPVPFAYQVQDGDHIHVHPVPAADSAGLDWSDDRLQLRPLHRNRFACDQHLGKLARLLRILGFDTAYDNHWREQDLARLARLENRAVLTCHRALLKRKSISSGYLVRSRRPDDQVAEVVRRFGLTSHISFNGRCCLCNGILAPVAKAQVWQRIPIRTRQWRDTYFLCRQCDHLYWDGSHVAALRSRIAAILDLDH